MHVLVIGLTSLSLFYVAYLVHGMDKYLISFFELNAITI